MVNHIAAILTASTGKISVLGHRLPRGSQDATATRTSRRCCSLLAIVVIRSHRGHKDGQSSSSSTEIIYWIYL